MINKNELPKNWEIVKLGEICEIFGGGTPSRQNSSFFGGDILWLTPTEIHKVSVKTIFDSREKITELGLQKSSAKIIPKGSVLLTSRATIGNVAISGKEVTTNQGFASFICPKNLNNKYLAFWLKSIKKKLNDKARGTTFKEISKAELKNFHLPLPPLAEQERIVAKIEELFSELDAGIESLKTAQAQLKIYRQAVLKYAFEGKLTNENVNEGELPQGWKWETIGNICKTIDGDRGTNYPKKAEFSYEGYCLFLSTKNVRDGRFVFDENIFISKEKDEKLRGGKLELNDVVITTRGTLGNVALYNERIPFKHIRINSGMLILRITNKFLSNYYLMKFITSPVFTAQLKEKQTGTAQPQIPANILREIEIPICPLEEQQRIVEEIESRLSVCDKLEETIAASLKQSEALRQRILKKAFEGKLVEQNENDESAKVLLEKIKKEREKFLKEEKLRKENTPRVPKFKNMAEELKTILQLLEEKNEPIPTHNLWQSSEHKDDIDAFYAKVKELLGEGKIKETPRDGKESFLVLAASK